MGVCENPNEVHLARQKTYFNPENDQVNNIVNNIDHMKSRIRLEFSIEGIRPGHRYNIDAAFMDNNKSVYKSEVVNSHSNVIIFNTCHICDYFFEKQQFFNVVLYRDSLQEGNIQLTLGRVVGSPGSCFKDRISPTTTLIIRAQSLNNNHSTINLDFSFQNCYGIFNDPRNRVSFLITSNQRKVYSSESVNALGKFKKVKIPSALLENGFRISFYDQRNREICSKNDTIQSFTNQSSRNYMNINIAGQNLILINNSILERKYHFLEYIKSGVTIKLTIGIDFTSSNQPPNDPLSLHYLGGRMNDYEEAIISCGNILAYYDYNQLFPVYGFGALVKGEKQISMCFNVNFKQNPEIYTIENVLKAYRNCFRNITLAGPTNFCPLVKKAIEQIKKESDNLKYHILLILTDGIINDKQETIDALVEGSFLPLSVIIIGIGNDHFQEMIELDGDDNPITNSRGIKRMRDLVQFVPFNQYKYDSKELAEQVLEEIPRQITDYYAINRIYPENLGMIKTRNQFNSRYGPNY